MRKVRARATRPTEGVSMSFKCTKYLFRRACIALLAAGLMTLLVHFYRSWVPGAGEALLSPAYKLTIALDPNYVSRPTWYAEVLFAYLSLVWSFVLVMLFVLDVSKWVVRKWIAMHVDRVN